MPDTARAFRISVLEEGWHRSPIAFTCSSLQPFSSRESEGPCDLSPPPCPSVGCTLEYGIASSMEGKNASYRLKTSGGSYTCGSTAKRVAAGLKIILRKNQCSFRKFLLCSCLGEQHESVQDCD